MITIMIIIIVIIIPPFPPPLQCCLVWLFYTALPGAVANIEEGGGGEGRGY
jgi:hypothetical protein